MSQKNVKSCVVTLEPMPSSHEKMEAAPKEPSKKKASKVVVELEKKASKVVVEPEKKAAVAETSEPKPAAQAKNGIASSSEKPAEATPAPQPQENGVKPNTSSRPKREKNGTSSPAIGKSVSNGVTDVALNENGSTVDGDSRDAVTSPDIIEDENLVPNPEQDNDDLFPELNYDETSDTECNFDSSSPEFSPVNRSVTRRSQAKKIPTPETPQLSQPRQDNELLSASPSGRSPSTPQPDQTIPLREKVLKMKDAYCSSPRRDSPVSDISVGKKTEIDEAEESNESKNGSAPSCEAPITKTDTNFSKTRIKVSPYRRSSRLSEQYSTIANYSGNNTTQDTDVVEDISSSCRDRSPADDSGEEAVTSQAQGDSYSESFRNIKGRKSYRPLREISLHNLSALRQRVHRIDTKAGETSAASTSSLNATAGSEPCDTVTSESSTKWTPVGHVVGRKRRSEEDDISSPALDLSVGPAPAKRLRLLGYVASPFRQLRDRMASSTPINARYLLSGRMSAKVEIEPHPAADETLTTAAVEEPMAVEVTPGTAPEHKWCSIM